MTVDQRRPAFVVIKFEGERLLLPERLIRGAENAGISGDSPISSSLLVVSSGRYRLLSGNLDTLNSGIADLRSQIDATRRAGTVLDFMDNVRVEAIQFRLIPCVLSPPPPGWRVNFPKEAKELVPEKEERSFVFGLAVARFIELWFPDAVRRTLSVSISELLP